MHEQLKNILKFRQDDESQSFKLHKIPIGFIVGLCIFVFNILYILVVYLCKNTEFLNDQDAIFNLANVINIIALALALGGNVIVIMNL